MAQHITSMIDLRSRNVAESIVRDISLTDLLYLVHGSGSDRDQPHTVSELVSFLQTAFGEFVVATTTQGITWQTKMDPYGIEVKGTNRNVLRLSNTGFTVYAADGQTEVGHILVQDGKMVFSMASIFLEDVLASGKINFGSASEYRSVWFNSANTGDTAKHLIVGGVTNQDVSVPKLHVWDIAEFKKAVSIAKTLSVTGTATFTAAVEAPNTPTGITDIGSPDGNGNYFAFQLSSAWTAGQKKMIYNTTASDIAQSVYLASNASGSSHQLTTVTFPARRYVEMVYSGKTVTNGDNTFGVFFVGA